MAEPVGVLGQIVAAKREELSRRFDGVSLEALRTRAKPTRRSVARSIAQPGSFFILEIKKASPSHGEINSTADPVGIARSYAGVADALSVLTDRRFFGGSTEDLTAARSTFDGPILAKDFFMDPRQVAEARIAGADAILVMLSLLGDSKAREIMAEARRFGMDALVEVHDEPEMRRALALGAPLIGINNRDLRDLSVDLSTTQRLARMAPDRLLVSESGIHGRADIERLAGHVNGFLVGTSLMRSSNPAQAARQLVFGRVKVCGLRTAEDVTAARAAAYAGFVFVPETPRHVTAEQAAPLAGLSRKLGMLPVGVFRDAPLGVVGDIATLVNLHAVQLHGSEDLEYVRALRRKLSMGCELWNAVDVARGTSARKGADRLVFDNGPGGTGRAFDWELVRRHNHLSEALLAGGIGARNARAAASLGAHAIDVGSSVENLPGVKSPKKIHALFEALREPCREQLRACA